MAWFTTTLAILYNKSCCRAKQTLERYAKALECYTKCLYRFLYLRAQQHPLLAQACYFTSISLVGLVALKSLPFKGHAKLKDMPATDLDLFFTSVSAATVSSMSTVEMEVFSEAQLAVLTLLMLAGGEVLLSAITLHFENKMLPPVYKQQQLPPVDLVTIYVDTKANSGENTTCHPNTDTYTDTDADQVEPIGDGNQQLEPPAAAAEGSVGNHHHPPTDHLSELRCNAMKSLAGVYRTYLLFMHIAGSLSVVIYLLSVADARERLREKGIRMSTFSVFTTVSSFSNCGFIPTNENMMVFSNNSGLLLLIIPQILLGNTLFPPCLRLCLWLLEKLTKRAEYGYLLKNWKELEVGGSPPADHYYLFSYTRTVMLVYTVVGLILIQTVAILSMEWRSPPLAGMDSSYQKLVVALFMSVNSRHAGESVFDLSTLSQAVLVIFVIMMYLPPHTTFIPVEEEEEEERLTSNMGTNEKGKPGLVRRLALSELSYMTLAIILICITEREKLKTDPLNFNVFNILIEVISAYGNVGFSTGYSCKRQLEPDRDCQDRWYGFAGKWSSQGKLILILVMFIGKLKKFSRTGGKAWKLH